MSTREIADEKLKDAVARTGARDPRGLQRESLRRLKEMDTDRYDRASRYYEENLLPEVAREGGDPLGAWLEYGRFLAALRVDGKAVQIDPTGHSEAYQPPVPMDRLVLHLPDSTRESAIVIGLPTELSPAQKATYDLLVLRKVG